MTSWLKRILSTIATASAWLLAPLWRRKLYRGKLIRYVATETLQIQDRQIHRAQRVRRREESVTVGGSDLRRATTRVRRVEDVIDVIEDGTVVKTIVEW